GQAGPEDRHLRRARRRAVVGRVLLPGRAGLRLLFPLPHPDRARGRRPGHAPGGQPPAMIPRPIARMRLLFATLAVAGCTASAEQVAPPQYNLYFPTGMVLSPDERYLFVVSADSDLRYSDGALHTIDLDQVDAIADAWLASRAKPNDCTPIADRPTVLSCPTTRGDGTPISGMLAGGSVEIGSFGVSVGVQPLKQNGGPSSILRLFATVRGDPSLTWMDFDTSSGQMTCGEGGSFIRCDEEHRLA